MSSRYGAQTSVQTAVFLNGGDLDCDVRRITSDTSRRYLTLRCDESALLRVHFDQQDAAKLVRALLSGAHEALQDAELTCEQWDVVLLGLDAMVNTAAGKRAEAFHDEYGWQASDPWIGLRTDHCGDHIDQAVAEGST